MNYKFFFHIFIFFNFTNNNVFFVLLKNLEVLEISSSIILDEVGNKDGDLKKLRVFNISQSTDFKNLNLIKNSYNLEIKILIKFLYVMFLKSTKEENFLFRNSVRFSDF